MLRKDGFCNMTGCAKLIKDQVRRSRPAADVPSLTGPKKIK